MGKATVYYIMHTERCVAQVSTAGECKTYFEDFMPYDLVLKELRRRKPTVYRRRRAYGYYVGRYGSRCLHFHYGR